MKYLQKELEESFRRVYFTALPPLSKPAVLNRRCGMAQVVMVINHMAIAEVPIVRERVSEFPLDPTVHLLFVSWHSSVDPSGPSVAIILIT